MSGFVQREELRRAQVPSVLWAIVTNRMSSHRFDDLVEEGDVVVWWPPFESTIEDTASPLSRRMHSSGSSGERGSSARAIRRVRTPPYRH
jgi:hypothetical protein